MMMTYNKYIQEYLDIIDNEVFPVCKEQKLLSKFIKKIFETENLIIDEEKVEKYFSYQKYLFSLANIVSVPLFFIIRHLFWKKRVSLFMS